MVWNSWISLGPALTGFNNPCPYTEIEQATEQLKGVAWQAPGVMTIGGETLPSPTVPVILDYIERGHSGVASIIGGAIIMEGTPSQIASAHLAQLGVGFQVGKQFQWRDVTVHPADHR